MARLSLRRTKLALQTLFEYAPRYAESVRGLGFKAPTRVADLVAVERLHGDAGTDMGSLSGIEPTYDGQSQPANQRRPCANFIGRRPPDRAGAR